MNQLDWDPEKNDDDGYPLVDANGSTLEPTPRKGHLDEDEASSLTAWARIPGSSEKHARFKSRDVVITNTSQAGSRKSCVNSVREETTETRPKHPHFIPR